MRNLFKICGVIAIVIMFTSFGIAAAQEATETPIPVATEVVSAPTTTPVVIVEQRPQNDWLEVGVILSLVVAVVGAGLGMVTFLREHPNATIAAIDQEGASQINRLEQNRQFLDHMEVYYKETSSQLKSVYELMGDVLKISAPLTGSKTLEALQQFLDDVKEPGLPKTVPAPEPAPTPPVVDTPIIPQVPAVG